MSKQETNSDRVRDVIVIGAGPAGLAAAIAARKASLDCETVERRTLVHSILNFPTNMVFFTTPELLELGELPFVTPYAKPTRDEALRYYRRVVDTYDLTVKLGYEVVAVRPQNGHGGASQLAVDISHPEHGQDSLMSKTVVVAVGAYECPNLLNVPGEDLPHVSHYYTEAHPYYRKQVIVVGGKNSAAEAALELYRAGAYVTLVHRRSELGAGIKYWVRPDIDNRIQEGSVAAHFESRVVEIKSSEVVIEKQGLRCTLPAEGVFLLTGYHPDTAMLERFGVEVDAETMVPSHNPETYETNVQNVFLAGQVLSGIYSGQIFIENGRFHGARVIQEIARRLTREQSRLPAPG